MKTYETFARDLDRPLGGEQAVRITVPGYMPLTRSRPSDEVPTAAR